jgi:5'-nucleotidase (lipoprotein e(P4) family)
MRMSSQILVAACLAGSLTSCATGPDTVRYPASATLGPTSPSASLAALQWLYGSGEGAAASMQAYARFRDYVIERARARPEHGVVLAAEATLDSVAFRHCGNLPLAVVLDVDETVIQNLGYQYDRDVRGLGFDEDSWGRWEQTGEGAVRAMPGAVEAISAIRSAGVTVIFNTNRRAENAAASARAIERAGFGIVEHRHTLWLMGDTNDGSRKDGRRSRISERYCVIAMAGDQLGDFSDLFRLPPSQRRAAAQLPAIAALWGNGWFILANPVYGSALVGTRDEIFLPDVRWRDMQP